MLLTGLLYAFVGIKNPWIHAFFSTAFMAALGITVLIVYVMNVPLNNALQGGYVAAVVLSGCAIGTASMFFKELTEGLGCALGGFCVSMWLLCLVPGGLLQSTAAKAIFIACFTIVGFAFYFSRFTRDWSLIVSIAFAGATVAVIGIDCFSRAGLKEFWAYIWSLNNNLFPLGADTYPVTRGIRVETAAIIIIFLIATMSQVRLWKIVREKREKRAAARAEGQRNLDEEEEAVGRQIEQANARERVEWERVYGEGVAESVTASHLSVNGDVHEKHRMESEAYAARDGSGETTDMGEMSECGQSAMEHLMAGEGEDGGVTVRVAADEFPEGSLIDGEHVDEEVPNEKTGPNPMVPVSQIMAETRASKTSSRNKPISTVTAASQNMPTTAITPSPDVVPLPFNVPSSRRPQSQRSSVATFADVEEEVAPASPRRVQRHSVVQRLSQGSVDLLRSISQRSARSSHTLDNGPTGGESTEFLVAQSKKHRQHKDNESLAATVDYESLSEGGRSSMEMPEEEAAEEEEAKNTEMDIKPTEEEGVSEPPRVAEQKTAAVKDEKNSFRSQVVTGPPEESVTAGEDESVYAPQSEMPKSLASGRSGPVNLTKDRLPQSLSRVALSYRTNEWAKHLSNADMPSMDDLPAENLGRATKIKERAKPVNIQDLQRTAEDGAPAPALPLSQSRASMITAASSHVPETATMVPEPVKVPAPTVAPLEREPSATSPISPMDTSTLPRLRSTSSMNMRKISPTVQPIIEEERNESAMPGALPVPQEGVTSSKEDSPELQDGQFVKPAAIPGVISYSSPQTLLGQREMFLRTRSQGSLVNTVGEMQSGTPLGAPPSDAGSLHNYPMYAAALAADPDEIPLSQRRSIMINSRTSTNESSYSLNRADGRAETPMGADAFSFNSHQPMRGSGMLSPAARDAQLANFRMSVTQDLRAGSPMMSGSRETPFASTNSLLGGREADVQRNIEMQRHVMMGQKEAEAQKREMQRRDKEYNDRVFDDRMRTGDLLDAHREAMRKMQRGAR